MSHFEETSLIGMAAELQVLSHSKQLQLSFKQRRSKDDFFGPLNYFIDLNLAKFADEDDPAVKQMEVQAAKMDEAILETLFSENERDSQVAEQVLTALNPGGAQQRGDDRGLPLPSEFSRRVWQQFYLVLNPQEELADDQFDRGEARHAYRFARQRFDAGDHITVALMEFVAGRFHDARRKVLLNQIIEVASDRPLFYLRIAEPAWIETFHRAGGPVAVGKGLAASLAVCAACDSDESAVALDTHLQRTLPSLKSRFEVVAALGMVAQSAGICPELRRLLDVAANEEQWKRTLKHLAMPKGGKPCTITAQRLTCKMLHRYGMGNYKAVTAFNRRIRDFQLEDSLSERVDAKMCNDKEFAAQMIQGAIDLKSLAKQARSIDPLGQFLGLTFMAMAAFDGPELGSVSRGLSLLLRTRRDRKVDDQHYSRMMDALTQDLPSSLLLMNELPADMDPRLSRLFIPLLVAIELYDDTSGEDIRYLSDAYYQLGKYDQRGRGF